MKIKHFFDNETCTLTYLVYDENTKDAVLIDPVLNFDDASGSVFTASVEKISDVIHDLNLSLHYVLDTHVHADHLSGMAEIKKRFSKTQSVIGENIAKVQETFKSVFNLSENFATDGSQFDVLLKDSDTLKAGSLIIKALNTSGHTPSCMSYLINNEALFTGDALFMPDSGTGRCDFPGGDAEKLYESIVQKIYTLPDEVRVYTGHDYMPGGRALKFESTVGEEKIKNIHLTKTTSKEKFISLRQNRDKTLKPPKLFTPSLQVNIRAGHLTEQR